MLKRGELNCSFNKSSWHTCIKSLHRLNLETEKGLRKIRAFISQHKLFTQINVFFSSRLVGNKKKRLYPKWLWKNDLRQNDFRWNDFGKNNFGKNNFGKNDSGKNDSGKKNFRPNDFGGNDFGQNDMLPINNYKIIIA